MKKRIGISIVALISVLFCYTVSEALEVSAMGKSASEEPYALINNVTVLHSEEHNITVKIFETGGGDPAMNGNNIILHIREWDPDGHSYTWISGINIYDVTHVAQKDAVIIIHCTEHVMNAGSGGITTVPARYSISYFFDHTGSLKNVIKVEKIEP